jgi:cytochrome P450
MRLHPILPQLVRTAARDDVIPLANPLRIKSGQLISEIPVSKGQNFMISVCGYNRLASVWGEDAEEWHPERFLGRSTARQTSVGVLDNLWVCVPFIHKCNLRLPAA